MQLKAASRIEDVWSSRFTEVKPRWIKFNAFVVFFFY